MKLLLHTLQEENQGYSLAEYEVQFLENDLIVPIFRSEYGSLEAYWDDFSNNYDAYFSAKLFKCENNKLMIVMNSSTTYYTSGGSPSGENKYGILYIYKGGGHTWIRNIENDFTEFFEYQDCSLIDKLF